MAAVPIRPRTSPRTCSATPPTSARSPRSSVPSTRSSSPGLPSRSTAARTRDCCDVMIEPFAATHRAWADALLERDWGGRVQWRRGELVDVSARPGFVAVAQPEDEPVGIATYSVDGREAMLEWLA